MIRVITVEREYGSRGAEFATHLAKHLGWKLIDQCLIEEIAQKAGVTKSSPSAATSGLTRGITATARPSGTAWSGCRRYPSRSLRQRAHGGVRARIFGKGGRRGTLRCGGTRRGQHSGKSAASSMSSCTHRCGAKCAGSRSSFPSMRKRPSRSSRPQTCVALPMFATSMTRSGPTGGSIT